MPLFRSLFLFFSLCHSFLLFGRSPIVSTDSDPDAFIQDCVNVINGDYCETAIDLIIEGPNPLVLQRFYSTQDSIKGTQTGSWKIFPERFLVVGKDRVSGLNAAFTGERSGAVLPYKGIGEVLSVDTAKALGMVNSYAKEISGQTNHRNNRLDYKEDTCKLTLGDGTKRIYKRVETLPSLLLGEENIPLMAAQLVGPAYFVLIQEILPKGNSLFFSYDESGHLIAVEMQSLSGKILSWMHLSYIFQDDIIQVAIETSDARKLTYTLALQNNTYQLTHVIGSHCIPVSYEYDTFLIRKTLPEGRFIEVDYKDGKVHSLKGPNATSGQSETVYTFSYGKNTTDVFDAAGTQTRYAYDDRFQLTSIKTHNEQGALYRKEQRFWGKTPLELGSLLAKTIADGKGRIHSYRSFKYDLRGNVLEERLYGNLTGKKKASLQVTPDGSLLNPDDEECHLKTFEYNGYNLPTKMGDCKGNHTLYTYKPGTRFLIKKYIYDKDILRKRTFYTYNEEGVCIKTIEDDGTEEKENDLYRVKERHIKEITPKETLPGVGLPLVIEEKAVDLNTNKTLLVKKFVNTYDDQANLLSCATYDANGDYAFSEKRTYTPIGKVASQTDGIGREEFFTYDSLGNCLSHFIPYQNKTLTTHYDFHNKPLQVTETNLDETFTLYNIYDSLSRKIASLDRYGNATQYTYDCFHRLTKVIHPEVADENGNLSHPTFTFTYDIFGNVLTTQDPQGYLTKKSYTLRGDPTKISYPDGSYELFKYDPEGSLHRSLSRDQIITIYEYDYLGRSVYEECLAKGESSSASFIRSRSRQYNGFRCTYEKEDIHIKQYFFDPAGRLATLAEYESGQNEKNPEARISEFSYDSLGRVHKRKIWFDVGPKDYSLEIYTHDLAGNVLEKRIEDAHGTLLLQRHYTYDIQGRCEEEYGFENDQKITFVKTTYNSQGEPIAHSDGMGYETKVILDHYHINSLGQTVLKKTLINPSGVQTEIEFDPLARIASLIKKDSLGLILSSQRNSYDLVGNKTSETHDQIFEGKKVGEQTHRFVFGPMGRLDQEIRAADSLAQKTHYEYNSLGQMTRKSLDSGTIHYTYNKSGHLYKVEAEGNKEDQKISNSYSYDRQGNITSAHSLHGKSIQRTYNVFHQVTQEIVKDGEGSYTLKYTYDRKGRIKEILLPDQSKIAYTYDAVFGRTVNRISSQKEILYTHHYNAYDLQGKLLSEKHIGSLGDHTYAYNANGQKIVNRSPFFNEEYTRDLLGRITEVKGKHLEEYIYNDLSQLVSEKKSTTTTHSYDSLDNRIQTNNETLIYNALNQLTHRSKGEYSYDPQGNLLRKVLDGEETHFENNLLSQLTFLEKDQKALSFSYDPFGRLLVEKHLDTKGKIKRTLSTTRYLYLGHQEIGTLSQKGTPETLKIPGLQGDKLSLTSIAFEIQGQTYVPLHDVAGNVISLVDPFEGTLLESYEYTAFGEEKIFNALGERTSFSSFDNPWRFAEKRMDEKTGLILFGLRFYDPSIGRWISQDPSGFTDGPNLYAYLRNNPLNHLDRFGLETESESSGFQEYFFGELEPHCFCERHRTCKRGGDIWRTAKSFLPKITYDDDFEIRHKDLYIEDAVIEDYYKPSRCYDLDGLPDLPKDMGIGFINGVWNTFKDSKENAEYVSKLAGGCNIHGVYNATHGAADPKECRMGLNFIATEPVRQLHAMWNSFFEKSSSDAKFLMICHSQGAIHVRNALLDYPPELRSRIMVVAIAPAAYIYSETCAEVFHYRVDWKRDLIPYWDSAGAEREKDTTVTLNSHSDASYFDHKFISPTYQERLRRHIKNYIQSQGKIL